MDFISRGQAAFVSGVCVGYFFVNTKSVLKGVCLKNLTCIPVWFGVQSCNEKFWQQGYLSQLLILPFDSK